MAELRVFDTAGQLVLQQTLQRQTSVNVSNLQKWLYFVEITSGNSIWRQRISRQ